MRGKAELPAGLKLPGELRLKLRRPTAKDAPAERTEVRVGKSPAQPCTPPSPPKSAPHEAPRRGRIEACRGRAGLSGPERRSGRFLRDGCVARSTATEPHTGGCPRPSEQGRRRSTGRRIIGLGGSCPKAFRRKSAWRSAESRAKRCWITSSRRRKTVWKSVRPGACRPKRSPRWTP